MFTMGRTFIGLVAGAGVAATGFVLTVLDVGARLSSPQRRIYAALWFVAFVVFIAFAGFKLLKRVAALEKEREPKFDILFEPENDDDARPYLESREYTQTYPVAPARRMQMRKYRVGVVNLSRAVVPSVSVVLHACDPVGNSVRVGHRLQVMDRDGRGEAELPVSLDGKPTVFFDVVREISAVDDRPSEFGFCYANKDTVRNVEQSPHYAYSFRVVLRAEGAGYSCQREFQIDKLRDDALAWPRPVRMRPL